MSAFQNLLNSNNLKNGVIISYNETNFMKNKKISFSLLLTCLVIICSTVGSLSQVLPPPPPAAGGAPLDPLSWVLLGSGGVFAGKKYLDKRKNNKH